MGQKNVFLIIKIRASEYIKFNYKPNKKQTIFYKIKFI